jgi:hypothetical protein
VLIWKGSGVLDGGNFTLMCGGNESNTFGTGFIFNRKYKQAIMNLAQWMTECSV